MKTCCEFHGMPCGCEQGRLCPSRQSYPRLWWFLLCGIAACGLILIGATK
jgi:hypothetical protein